MTRNKAMTKKEFFEILETAEIVHGDDFAYVLNEIALAYHAFSEQAERDGASIAADLMRGQAQIIENELSNRGYYNN